MFAVSSCSRFCVTLISSRRFTAVPQAGLAGRQPQNNIRAPREALAQVLVVLERLLRVRSRAQGIRQIEPRRLVGRIQLEGALVIVAGILVQPKVIERLAAPEKCLGIVRLFLYP